MERDIAAELIEIRRALPNAVGLAATVGGEPGEGLSAVVPEDAAWRILALPTDTGWRITEVREIAEVPAAEAPATIAEHFRRRQLLARNAACGTPLEP